MLSITRRKLIYLLPFGAIWVPLTSIAQGFATFNRSKLRVVTKSGKHEFIVEIAVTDRQHSQGLMFRQSLAKNAGMLFDYKVPTSITMWMKNTYIPLDMIFIGNDGRVINVVQRAIPFSENVISSLGKARGVLEVNGGTASRLGIMPGDKILHRIFGNME
ncbi:MAG TPA: DUF192 domain-containing protein [Rhodospirillales bacterium]|nr:DUF192 domain-containing protein [Rhodospirillales bacterium]